MKKHYYTWQDIEKSCIDIALQMYKDNWTPDYIVGITKSGNIPASILSHILGIPCESLNTHEGETNCWMSEDAFGVVPAEMLDTYGSRWDSAFRKKILITNDINSSGGTFKWLIDDWQQSCHYNNPVWKAVWGENVRFATITNNLASEFDSVQYTAFEINKAEEDIWVCYPWETVGRVI